MRIAAYITLVIAYVALPQIIGYISVGF